MKYFIAQRDGDMFLCDFGYLVHIDNKIDLAKFDTPQQAARRLVRWVRYQREGESLNDFVIVKGDEYELRKSYREQLDAMVDTYLSDENNIIKE